MYRMDGFNLYFKELKEHAFADGSTYSVDEYVIEAGDRRFLLEVQKLTNEEGFYATLSEEHSFDAETGGWMSDGCSFAKSPTWQDAVAACLRDVVCMLGVGKLRMMPEEVEHGY